MKRIFTALVLLSSAVSLCSAQGKGYAGTSIGTYVADAENYPKSDPKAVSINLGYDLLDSGSIELRAGFGLGSRDERVVFLGAPDDNPVDVKFELQNYYSIFFKPQYAIDRFVAYGLLGYTESSIRAEAEEFGIETKDKESGPSLGFGIGFQGTDRLRLGLEYQQVIHSSKYKLRGINFTIQSFFR